MDTRRILRNRLQCRLCGDIIESRSTHELVHCKCGSCFVDGGRSYVRFGAKSRDDIVLLTEYEETPVRILNIHGYGGSAENAAWGVLHALGCDIISPAIDYDAQTPAEIYSKLRRLVRSEKIGLLTGTSLGGFYASVLAAELHLPVILVNPCLCPFLTLPRLGYHGDIQAFFPLFGKLSQLDRDTVSCIIGGRDEVVDTHDLTRNLMENERFRVIPDGMHSGATLPLLHYFSELMRYYGVKTNRGTGTML